jgi:mono/diheme cytochrome c family protein
MKRILGAVPMCAAAVLVFSTTPAGAQNAGKNKNKDQDKAKQAAPTQLPSGGAGGAAYPQRPRAAEEVIARGQKLYNAECAFCHGEDARGGETASNLIRSQVVLNDDKGERLGPVLRQGVEGTNMPKYTFTDAQVSDIAAFLHSFRVNGYDGSRNRPETIVVGNARDGQAFFTQKCASCHSVTGDLKGIAARIDDPRTLQQRWLNPAGGGRGVTLKPTIVVVTQGNQKTQGTLVRIDDFTVTLTLDDGRQRTFRRDGDVPKVEIQDPYGPHKALIPTYTDKNIHDVTAYLVTLK